MQLATAQKELARAHVLAEAFYASDKDGESEREKDVTMKMATARFHVHKAEEAVNKVKTSLSQAEAESMAAMSTEEGALRRAGPKTKRLGQNIARCQRAVHLQLLSSTRLTRAAFQNPFGLGQLRQASTNYPSLLKSTSHFPINFL